MSLIQLNILGPLLFSYTGLLWGFLLAAIAVEELKELKEYLEKTKTLLSFIVCAVFLYLGFNMYPQSNIDAGVLLVIAVGIPIIQVKNKSVWQELWVLAPISFGFLTVLLDATAIDKLLLLASVALLYFILLGVKIHSTILNNKSS
ncbi:hypothetical protein CL619_04880 [archaeon]|nr:hypothetical protein [archaeon]|tara:strand:- start:89 stop:526 length:438 start_codon:yes stop_codon:yes gene_type:complete